MSDLQFMVPPDSSAVKDHSLLAYALAYAEHGWPVFSLHSMVNGKCSCRQQCTSPGKHPRTPNGFYAATTDEAKIKAWWSIEPPANIGVPTGRMSGLVVLDIDPKHSGPDSWGQVSAGQTPIVTATTTTGSGGTHYIFQNPGVSLKNSESEIAPGLDTRAEGGYIVAPPSNHISGGCYSWVSLIEPAVVPAWLLALWPKLGQVSNTPPPAVLGDVTDGHRNSTLVSWAGSMHRRGMSRAAILAALLVENETRCKPPLAEKVVHTIVNSMSRYPLGTPAPLRQKAKQGRSGTHRNSHPVIHLPDVEVQSS
jgi:putative DNA primase/helicase